LRGRGKDRKFGKKKGKSERGEKRWREKMMRGEKERDGKEVE